MIARTSVPRSTAARRAWSRSSTVAASGEHARHRRVVHREDRAERRGRREHVREPGELLVAQLAVVEAGHGRVERDEPQAVELVDAVDRASSDRRSARRAARARKAGAVVVVAHHPEHAGAEPRGERLDDRPQLGVGVALAEVDEVAGEDDAVGCDAGCLDRGERAASAAPSRRRGRTGASRRRGGACRSDGAARAREPGTRRWRMRFFPFGAVVWLAPA